MNNTQTLNDCVNRVRGATRGLTEEQIQDVARHHFTTGDCVWHSVTVVLGTATCPCKKCNPL